MHPLGCGLNQGQGQGIFHPSSWSCIFRSSIFSAPANKLTNTRGHRHPFKLILLESRVNARAHTFPVRKIGLPY